MYARDDSENGEAAMSIMSGDRPVYTLPEFVVTEDVKTWEETCYKVLLYHCFFGKDWQERVDEALAHMWNNESRPSHWKLRSIIFQERNPICDVRMT